jgi:hypothetical protein
MDDVPEEERAGYVAEEEVSEISDSEATPEHEQESAKKLNEKAENGKTYLPDI